MTPEDLVHWIEDTARGRVTRFERAVRASDSFPAIGMCSGEECPIVAGYLMKEGEKADLVSGQRRVLERHRGWPTRVAVEVEDRLGRRIFSVLGNRAFPYFMSHFKKA